MRNTPGLPGGALCPAGPRLRSRLAQTLDNGGVGHPAALTHCLQPVTTAALLERIHEYCHDARTASAQRVADRDRATVHVSQLKDASLLPIYVLCPCQHQVLRDPADSSITVGVKRHRTKTETQVYLYLSDRIERLIYNFPVLISSPIFRIGVWFSGCTLSQRLPCPNSRPN
jgi:hypothetical protein